MTTTNTTTNEETLMQHALRSGLGRRAQGKLAAMVAAVMLLAVPGPVHAGEYVQHFCSTGYADPTANAWYGVGSPAPGAACNPGAGYPANGVYFNTSTLPLNGYGGLRAEAPAGARYKSINLNLRVPYQATNRRTYIEANSSYVFSWWNGWGGTWNYNPDGNFFTVALGGSSYFEIGQACHGASAAGCEAGDFYFSGAQATLTDTTFPSVTAVTNQGLFDSGRTMFRGAVSVAADITDGGHGPASAKVQIDGADYPGASSNWVGSCNYRLSNPCSARLGWSNTINTASYPDGTHTVKVIGDDGVGQAAFTDRSVVFDNTAPTVSGVSPIHGQTHSADRHSFAVSAADATSGVQRLEARIDSGGWQTIASAASGTVAVTGAGAHSISVRAIDRAGNTSPEALSSFTLQAPPTNQRLTTVQEQPLPGAPGRGDQIKCGVGTPWTTGTTFTYRWLRDGSVLDGATSQTYTIVTADNGHKLSCRLTATNPASTTERTSPDATAAQDPCFGFAGPGDNCDSDGDGDPNWSDPDDDNDGIPDADDAQPFDPAPCVGQPTGAHDPCGDNDHDGQPNHLDPDDDNDGVPDGSDPGPFDPTVPGNSGSSPGGPSTTTNTSTTNNSTSTTGNSSTVSGAGPVNGVGGNTATARFTSSSRRSLRTRYGRTVLVKGKLVDAAGRPIENASVDVHEQVRRPGAALVKRVAVQTNRDGVYAYRAPVGPSRTLRFAYASRLGDAEYRDTADVELRVRAVLSVKAKRKRLRPGGTLRLRGRIRGGQHLPARGTQIEIQARDGRTWRTISIRKVRRGGKLAYSYRFRRTRKATFLFRVILRGQANVPLDAARSKAVRIRVG
jgi:hypothetical protein